MTPADLVVPVFYSTGALILWVIVTVLMPLLVGLLSKPSVPAWANSLGLLAASLANGFLSEWLAAGDGYDVRKGLLQAVLAYVVAVAMHFGAWKPLTVTEKALRVGARSDYTRAA